MMWLKTKTTNGLIGWAILAALAFAFYLQFFKGMAPCPLCIVQRIAFAGLALAFFIKAWRNLKPLGFWLCQGFSFIFIGLGLAAASRQIWLQYLPHAQDTPCLPGVDFLWQNNSLPQFLALFFQRIFSGTPDCALIHWTFLGLSLAAWSLVAFIVLLLIWIAQSLR